MRVGEQEILRTGVSVSFRLRDLPSVGRIGRLALRSSVHNLSQSGDDQQSKRDNKQDPEKRVCLPPNRSREPETACDRNRTDVNPSSKFPIRKFKHDADHRKNYLKNKFEAQLEVQRRESYASQPGKHCPSDEGVRSYNPSTTKDSPQYARRASDVEQRQRPVAFHM
jgi:hypothetical protein